MMKGPDPKKKPADAEETQASNNGSYIEPEAIDSHEPEDLDSDAEDV